MPLNLMPLKPVLVGVKKLKQTIDKKEKDIKKAERSSVQIVGYAMYKLQTEELKKGRSGDVVHAPSSIIKRRLKSGRMSKKPPLHFLSKSVRYRVSKTKIPRMDVGFLKTSGGLSKKSKSRLNINNKNVISGSRQNLAKKFQSGFITSVSSKDKKYLSKIGGTIGKRSPYRKFFFIKSVTKTVKTPARPIINPFWQKYKNSAAKQLEIVFSQKLDGQRVSSMGVKRKISG